MVGDKILEVLEFNGLLRFNESFFIFLLLNELGFLECFGE